MLPAWSSSQPGGFHWALILFADVLWIGFHDTPRVRSASGFALAANLLLWASSADDLERRPAGIWSVLNKCKTPGVRISQFTCEAPDLPKNVDHSLARFLARSG